MLGRAQVITGKWLFDTGKLDEAEARMKEGLKENPGDPTAIRYLVLIEEQRSAQNANSKPRNETRPVTAPTHSGEEASPAAEPLVSKVYQLRYSDPTNLVAILKPAISQRILAGVAPDTRQRQLIVVATAKKLLEVDSLIEKLDKMPVGSVPDKGPIVSKLEKIVLDEVMFDGVPLAEVLRFLDEQSRKHDPEKKGVNFLINPNTTQSAPASVIDPQTGQAIILPPPSRWT